MNILWLGSEKCSNANIVGGKVAPLSELAKSYPVPNGFCLTVEAFSAWKENGKKFSDEMRKSIISAYESLEAENSTPRVAVRSSGIDEDGEKSSFAGQYETFLNISGHKHLLEAIEKCWESANADRVKKYLEEQKENNASGDIAVFVQQLVISDISGVVFSINPLTKNEDEIVVNVNWGLGESVVSGQANPDTYTLCKQTMNIKKEQIADKNIMTVLDNKKTKEVKIPGFMSKLPVIDKSLLTEIYKLTLSLEKYFQKSVDIEFAFVKNKLHLLQCRPVTTL